LNSTLTTATPEEVATAAPLRTQSRDSVIAQQAKFRTEMPILQNAGIPTTALTPMQTFLDNEVTWWNANITLNTYQVQTRMTYYTEQLQGITKTLQDNVVKTLGVMDLPVFNKALETLAPITVISMVAVKAQATERNQQTQQENAIYNEDKINIWAMTKASFSYFNNSTMIFSIFLWATTIVIASYVANDSLHKKPAFRVLAFFMLILFVVFSPFGVLFIGFMTCYYIYRYISFSFFNNKNNRILSLCLLPTTELTVAEHENTNFMFKYLYKYTLGEENSVIRQHVNDLKVGADIARFKCLSNTKNLQSQLYEMRKAQSYT
jgi:hypothetical protein